LLIERADFHGRAISGHSILPQACMEKAMAVRRIPSPASSQITTEAQRRGRRSQRKAEEVDEQPLPKSFSSVISGCFSVPLWSLGQKRREMPWQT